MKIRCPQKTEGFVDVAESPSEVGREDTQGIYQSAIADYVNNCTLLDVGAGLCESLSRFNRRGIRAMTQDVFPGNKADFKCPVEEIPSESFDVVTSFDVIEHVRDYETFFKELIRISKRNVFLSTPNYLKSWCQHRFHVQEFVPEELLDLGLSLGLKFESGWVLDTEKYPHGHQFQKVSEDEIRENKTCGNFGILFRLRVVVGLR